MRTTMNLTNLTHPLAISWDNSEQKQAVVAILDKKGAAKILYSGHAENDRIKVYPNTSTLKKIGYTDLPKELIQPYTTTIAAEQFINDNQ